MTIVLFFLLMIGQAVSAQDTPSPQVIVEITPEIPTAGAPLLLTLFVDYPAPDDVTVSVPPFADSLFFDRLVKAPKMMETEVWTVIEYRLIPSSHGLVILEPFTVICPAGTTETGPVVLDIHKAHEERKMLIPRIIWEGAPSQMTAGESVILGLRVNGWDSRRLAPGFFMTEVPQRALLELSQLSPEERAGGLAIRFNLIPMDAGDFRLPARILYYENIRFEIPALRIRVNNPPVAENMSPSGTAASGDGEARFPDFDFALFEKSVTKKTSRDQCENIYSTARNLWDTGFRAQALAELRRNERDHPVGVLFQPIRQEAEKNLGFYNTGNENRGRRKFLLGLSIFLFFLVIFSPFVCFFLLRGFFWKRAAFLSSVFFNILGLICLYRFTDSGGKPHFDAGKSRFGVAIETPVRRAADYDGEKIFYFKEGQPVIILRNSGSWVWVRANEATGGSGWIPAEAVIFY